MNEFLYLAKQRRSVRSYSTQKISREQIEKIILAGTWAPSAYNKQPWKFVVLENENKIQIASKEIAKQKQLAGIPIKRPEKNKLNPEGRDDALGQDPIFYNAPCVIFICIENNDSEYRELDVGLCAQNCFLQATELGIGTCAIGFAKYLENSLETKKQIGIPENYKIMLGFCLGFAEEKSKIIERKNPEIQFFN